MERLERVLGGLFGVACGDALGGTLEFTGEEHGKKLYGYHREITGGGVMGLRPGQVTDDTDMTLAVAEGILDNPDDPAECIGQRFIEWYKTEPLDIGATVNCSIENYLECGNWRDAALATHESFGGRSAGNGTLMRCIPPALYYKDFEKMVKVTIEQSCLTHYEEKASRACVLYNTLIFKYMKGENKNKALNEVLEKYPEYRKVLSMKNGELRPSGYVVDTLLCSLWCFINTSDFESAVCEAVNLYGDPDTIGAIAGGIAGVYYGYNSIPKRWKDAIIIKERLYDIGTRLSVE